VLSGSPDRALPAAAALGLLGQMRRVFTDLAAGETVVGLQTLWGLPRALNAGDALFNLAQATVLPPSLSSAQQLRLLDRYTDACRAFSESLYAPEDRGAKRRIIGAAFALGALSAGLTDAVAEALAGLAFAKPGDIDNEYPGLSEAVPGARQRLYAAIEYLREVGWL
jgi:hypothetical protein